MTQVADSFIGRFAFGPGQYESLTLKLWQEFVGVGVGRHSKLRAQLSGIYTVYCGAGWEHEVEIGIVKRVENVNILEDEEAIALWEIATYMDTVDTKYDLATRWVEEAFEDWSDPCEDDGEEL